MKSNGICFYEFLVELLKNLTFLTSGIMQNPEKNLRFLKDSLNININIFLNDRDLGDVLCEENDSKKCLNNIDCLSCKEDFSEEIEGPSWEERNEIIQKLLKWHKGEYEPTYIEFVFMEKMGLVERYYLDDIEIQQVLKKYVGLSLCGSKENDFACDWCGSEQPLHLHKIFLDGHLCGLVTICKACFKEYRKLKEKPHFSLVDDVYHYLTTTEGESR